MMNLFLGIGRGWALPGGGPLRTERIIGWHVELNANYFGLMSLWLL